MTFREWIDQKTPETLHIVLNVEIGTIRVWRHRNYIPRSVWPVIIREWRDLATDVNDLFAMEAASK